MAYLRIVFFTGDRRQDTNFLYIRKMMKFICFTLVLPLSFMLLKNSNFGDFGLRICSHFAKIHNHLLT